MKQESKDSKVDCYTAMTHKAEMFKALANPIRLCLLKIMIEEGPKNVTYFTEALATSQSNISQNLGRMRAMGYITSKKSGNHVIYACENQEIIKIYRAAVDRD